MEITIPSTPIITDEEAKAILSRMRTKEIKENPVLSKGIEKKHNPIDNISYLVGKGVIKYQTNPSKPKSNYKVTKGYGFEIGATWKKKS